MSRKISIIIFIMLMISTISLPVSGFTKEKKIEDKEGLLKTDDIDWWPSDRHDPQNTASSSSIAPESDMILYNAFFDGNIKYSPIIADQKVYINEYYSYGFLEGKTTLFCLDHSSGEQIWDKVWYGGEFCDNRATCPAYYNGNIYISVCWSEFDPYSGDMWGGCYLQCLDGSNGDYIWSGLSSNAISTPVVTDGKLYIGYEDDFDQGNLACLDADTGDVIWIHPLNSGNDISRPIVSNKCVYIVTDENHEGVICFNASTGDIIWNNSDIPCNDNYPPAFYDNKIFFSDEKIYCLDAENGNVLWNFTYEGEDKLRYFAFSNERLFTGGTIVNSHTLKTYCLDVLDGSIIWCYETNHDSLYSSSTPIVADNHVFITIEPNGLICLDAEGNGDGTTDLIWSSSLDIYGSLSIADGILYCKMEGRLVCFCDTNLPPQIYENPSGAIQGFVGLEYTFTINIEDPENNEFYCKWDWGDGEISDWNGPYQSGDQIFESHIWKKEGLYSIKVKAKDTLGAESQWSDPFEIVISKLNNGSWLENTRFVPDISDEGDYFGSSVAIDGDYAIIGESLDDDNGAWSGSAYIYHKEGDSWIEQIKLLAPDGEWPDRFGCSVAIDGDYAVIGAKGSRDMGVSTGSAYIYQKQGDSWFVQTKLVASDGAYGDTFGCSVSIDGDYAIIGAFLCDDLGESSGAAYIFYREGNNWIEQTKLIASDGDSCESFGLSVCINGDYAVVGASAGDNDMDVRTGSAYIFHKQGDSWIEQTKLLASDGAYGDSFGCAVSIDGDNVIVGAYKDDDNGENSGSAYLFCRNEDMWIEETKLVSSNGLENDNFGCSVSISGDYAIIGAQCNDEVENAAGTAYIFQREEGTWVEKNKLLPTSSSSFAFFGSSVSIDRENALVGAPQDSVNQISDEGSVYLYNRIDGELISIGTIKGGLLKIRSEVVNSGDINIDIPNVEWSIILEGGLLLSGREASGTIPLLKQSCKKFIINKPVIGFGRIKVLVALKSDFTETIIKTADGFVFFPFVFIK